MVSIATSCMTTDITVRIGWNQHTFALSIVPLGLLAFMYNKAVDSPYELSISRAHPMM